MAATTLLTLFQLVPLPPAIWQALPGRAVFAQAVALSGEPQPWRPLAIVPSAAINAAGSLIVPVVTLWLILGLKPAEKAWLPAIMLGLIGTSALVAALQASGVRFDNPLINERLGEVSGMLANRNHFALSAALGCLLAPVCAFRNGHLTGWRGTAALGMVLLFILTILASGSRAGLVLGTIGIVLGLAMVQRNIRRLLVNRPRWVFPTVIVAVIVLVTVVILLSVAADRAVSIQRIFAIDAKQDLRARTLPTVLAMIWTYFPFGIGAGGFDPLFRLHEPFALLKPTYFNHAHNDLFEIVLTAGLPGLTLLLVALAWWIAMSLRAWWGRGDLMSARLGSTMLLLIVIASLSDYPARTPIIMATIVIAATWLAGVREGRDERALP
ncbi:O-antigen ligase family protein [Sphingomonas sp. 37zxx]|uniref:O-antigen ligase family protein n=1 Tax=Sphingomonas sp. 37zxx TaxID=1550073 RepID=UPI0018CD0598|nr:O-antigen ligase family protein [Sphingomonas sp. 37zxx]